MKLFKIPLPLVISIGILFHPRGSLAQTWTLTSAPTNAWSSVASSADGVRLLAAPTNGPLYLSTDSGATWSSNNMPVAAWAAVASSADGSRLFAASAGQWFYISTNSGATWSSSNSFSTLDSIAHWTSVACSTDGTTVAAAANGPPDYIFTSSDSAATCRVQIEGTILCVSCFLNVGGIASSADGNKIVAAFRGGFNGAVYSGYFDASWDSGIHWSQISGGPGGLSWTAVASSANGSNLVATAWFTDLNSPVLTSKTGGLSWMPAALPVKVWVAVASSADGTRLAAAALGGPIYTSTNAGASWISNNAPALNWKSVASSADGTRLIAASSQGIYVSQPAPALSIAPSSDNLTLSWPSTALSFALQQTFDLITPDWSPVPDLPVFTNGLYGLVVSPTNTATFYRLISP